VHLPGKSPSFDFPVVRIVKKLREPFRLLIAKDAPHLAGVKGIPFMFHFLENLGYDLTRFLNWSFLLLPSVIALRSPVAAYVVRKRQIRDIH
jgi:hypothetical protein